MDKTMDFEWSPEQIELYDVMVGFCKKKLNSPDLNARDRESAFSRSAWQLCADQGLLSACLDSEHGGSGLDTLSGVLLIEGLG
jgi:alkylation response protein AidB-like acyl-CoA dehydrogenase